MGQHKLVSYAQNNLFYQADFLYFLMFLLGEKWNWYFHYTIGQHSNFFWKILWIINNWMNWNFSLNFYIRSWTLLQYNILISTTTKSFSQFWISNDLSLTQLIIFLGFQLKNSLFFPIVRLKRIYIT